VPTKLLVWGSPLTGDRSAQKLNPEDNHDVECRAFLVSRPPGCSQAFLLTDFT
jgi:hypothetical protein